MRTTRLQPYRPARGSAPVSHKKGPAGAAGSDHFAVPWDVGPQAMGKVLPSASAGPLSQHLLPLRAAPFSLNRTYATCGGRVHRPAPAPTSCPLTYAYALLPLRKLLPRFAPSDPHSPLTALIPPCRHFCGAESLAPLILRPLRPPNPAPRTLPAGGGGPLQRRHHTQGRACTHAAVPSTAPATLSRNAPARGNAHGRGPASARRLVTGRSRPHRCTPRPAASSTPRTWTGCHSTRGPGPR